MKSWLTFSTFKNISLFDRAVRHLSIGVAAAALTLGIGHAVSAAPAQYPLFLSNPVIPIMMLNMSNDHQLFFKVYDDYADITSPTGGAPDGIPDTTYVHRYKYYGYFDSDKCYVYVNSRFEPNSATDATDGYCNTGAVSDQWNGNFLNWATMTRMDAVRKMLYGGYRSTDSSTTTVLERAFLPNDAHAFAKFYDGNDINKLTPFNPPAQQSNTPATGLTICNTTLGGSDLSQNVTNPPLLRVAKGNYSLWASNERWQCRWSSEKSAQNADSDTAISAAGIYAYHSNPDDTKKLTASGVTGDFNVRVKVCVSGMEEANCTQYPSTGSAKKPTGLLQKYGEQDKINFGLMTGSYNKNKSGGALRKAVGSMKTEVNYATNGTFKDVDGIVRTLNKLRIYGYRFGDGTYFGVTNSDDCSWGISSFDNGKCTNWGNPQAEIYLESLRYLTGRSANTSFNTDDSGKISGLATASWGSAPVNSNNYCAPLNVVQFNASTTSYDGDELGGFSDFSSTAGALNTWTNYIGDSSHENLSGNYFVGSNGVDKNQLCTPKSISNLSDVSGTCPDAPRLDGSYKLAGLAYYARRNDLMPSLYNGKDDRYKQTVRTFGVALSPAVPKVEISVPNSDKKITILPACRNTSTTPSNGNCAIVDFKFVKQTNNIVAATGQFDAVFNGKTVNTGKLYVNWEDSEQGGDYDQDLWGTIDYVVSDTNISVTTDAIAQSTPNAMGFGFVISGTSSDGFHVYSGINGFSNTKTYTTDQYCSNCAVADAAKTDVFTIGNSTANLLQTPLYYAAKWGGYDAAFETAAKMEAGSSYNTAFLDSKIKTRDTSDSYYFATDPRKLEESLDKAFSAVAAGVGSASAVATNSTRLSEGSYVYQAEFNSEGWNGTLNAYKFGSDGTLPDAPTVTTKATMPTSGTGRKVYTSTLSGSNLVLTDFSWDNLSSAQKAALQLTGETSDALAQQRADWLLGNSTNEGATGLRSRGTGADRNILGDIVNSSPVYSGAWDFHYQYLPGDAGATYRVFLETVKKPKIAVGGTGGRLYVSANDGMLHAFDAETLEEKFAYIPGVAFSKLAKLTKPDYGTTGNPHQFVVDGPIAIGDVYINNGWKTIIVGTLGAGGRGIYALDVTTEEPKVLFEISNSDFPQLGYVLGKPIIAPMKNGRFAVVFGNGDSSGTFSSLFVVDIQDPFNTSYTKVLSTGAGTGLSTPELMINSYGQVTAGYAGDIDGNLWRFDLSSSSASGWTKDYLIFTAKDSLGNNQPITSAPTLGLNAKLSNSIMVYVGTGKYYDAGDNSAGTITNSFYAVADTGATLTRSNLHKKTLSTNYASSPPKREVSGGNPDWSTDKGWYLDFNDTTGERVTTKALLIQDKLIFPTLIPSTASCDNGGKSWLVEVVAVGDKFVDSTVLDDNVYNDYLVLGDLGFGIVPGSKTASSSGSQSSGSSSSASDECTDGTSGTGAIVGSGTDASLMNEAAKYSKCGEGRQSWRQLK